MGYKKPERRGLHHHLEVAPFMRVGQMRRDGWTIKARCPVCHLDCWVSLQTLIRLNGHDLKLWNRTAQCRRYGCRGPMIFMATPPGEELGAFWPLVDARAPDVR